MRALTRQGNVFDNNLVLASASIAQIGFHSIELW
jgi:hypothetical protein